MIRQRKPIQRRKTPQTKAPWMTFTTPDATLKYRFIERSKARISPFSAKRLGEKRKYTILRKEWLPGKKCQKCQSDFGIEVHHRNGRTHGLLNDKRFWIPLCSECHDWVHHNIKEARKLDLICEHGEWNSKPKTTNQ